MRQMIDLTLMIFLMCTLASGCQTIAATGGVGYGTGAITVSGYGDFLYPSPPGAYELNKKGFDEFKRGNYGKAAEIFAQSLEKYPESPDAQYYLGLSQVAMGEREKGLRQLASFRDKDHFRQSSEVRWWANYFLKHKDRSADSILDTMRRVRGEAAQQEQQERWERGGLGWGM